MKRWGRLLVCLSAVVGLVAGVVPNPVFAAPGSLSIQKVAGSATVEPGQTFDYTIQVQCSTATAGGCVNAVLTDPLPPYITVNGPITVTGALTPPIVDAGPPISITFQDDLGGGEIGLVAGRIVTITIPVVVDPSIPVDQNGEPIINTASIDADNADEKESTATVTPDIEEILEASTSKSFDPSSQLAGSDDPVSMSLTGGNESNVPVDSIVIQDPITDPPPPDGTFAYLAFTGAISVGLPNGAETVQVEVYNSSTGTWVAGPVGPPPAFPAGVDPADVTGIRITFADTDGSGIPPGATGTVDVELEQRDPLPDPIPDDIVNDVVATVDREGETASAEDDAGFSIRESEISVDAGKSIDPSPINAGDSTTVTLTGTNATANDAILPLDSMTITEPASEPNPFEGPNAVTFVGFTDGVIWPTGADEATITYECSGAPSAPQTTTTPNTLPDPPDPCLVTGFSVTFDDTDDSGIAPGATATIPFTVDTPEDQPLDEFFRLNTVRVDGEDTAGNDDTAFALDNLVTIIDRLVVETDKMVSPDPVPGRPGQIVIAQLEGVLEPFPESTVDADTIVVQDPATMPDPNNWYDSFAPDSITATAVPDCATLTVQYTTDPNGGTWVDVPGLVDIPGPTIVNADLPPDVTDNAEGLRFVYVAEPAGDGCQGGFPPSTVVGPNIAFGIRPGGDADQPDSELTFTDCADTSASAETVDPPAESAEACDSVTVQPIPTVPGGGGGGGDGGTTIDDLDPIEKEWDLDSVTSRSQAQVGAQIRWSTEGYSGLSAVRISDIPAPGTTALPASVYDVFDLVRIDPITDADDPWLTYDQVLRTELFQVTDPTDSSTGTWIQPADDPCPAACDGTYPGYTVPLAERETTIAFRLIYVESPTRGDRLEAGAPPVGTGVAPSSGLDRTIHPVFQLRDDLRSDPDVPVLESITYNAGIAGLVENTVRLDAVFEPEDGFFTWDADDTIQLLDVPVTVNSTKEWTGGPLGIPEVGVPQEDYPLSRVSLTATNTTPALIDEFVITDDTAGDTFEWFNLVGFVEITPPADIGADTLVVRLERGGTATDYTRDEALALTEPDLVDVTQITLTYSGRISINEPAGAGTARVTFDVRLRTGSRDTGQPPTTSISPIQNQVTVEGSDLVGYPDYEPETGTSTGEAEMELVEQGIFVTATKSIDPESQIEPDDSPVTVTISGQPHGETGPSTPPPSRAVELVLVDDDPRLWNQYDLVSLDDVTYTFPIDQVRVDALTGGTWGLDAGGDPVVTGATWEIGDETTGTTLTLPTGVDPSEVQGLRFTFTREDGANWENPANPRQPVSFSIQRRDVLHVGPGGELETVPVTPDLDIFDPAPGEAASGVATNTSTAQAISSDVDAEGEPITSDIDDATDDIVYIHAPNSVAVDKLPSGNSIPPGVPFTYTLIVTNDGQIDLTNPVITDYLPVDAEGPMVVLADPPNYSYAISGGTGMPTDPADVTVTDDSTDPTEPTLVFEFPDGSTLPVGATYTITFDVVLRPGLPAGTEFTNTFGVVGDRPFDSCSPALDEPTGQCRDDAINSVQLAGAVSVAKLVQAEGSGVLGVTTDPAVAGADPADCVEDADGFYARPCVPIAEPGGEITFRMRFINSGNRPLDRLLGIDALPAVGDNLATVPALDRGSEWQPTFSGVRPVLADATVGTLNVWYTTGANSCDAVAPTLGGPAPNLLCPELTWVEWPDGDPLPVDPATVTGLQVEVLPETPLGPSEQVDVDFGMIAPAFAPDADYTAAQAQPEEQTYNTVGSTGRIVTDEGDGVSYTLPSEPPRVGVALANGPLALVKVVTGDASRWAPDEFAATVSCVSAGEVVPLPPDVANIVLVPDEIQIINNLPWGAECTLVETDNGQTSSSSTTEVVVNDDQEIATVVLTNVYDDAPLTIGKSVDSDAVDQNGDPVPYGPFTVRVRCSFRGEPVYADGYSLLRPMNVELADGDEITLTGLPVGSRCVIEETDSKGASEVTATVVTPDGTETVPRAEVSLPESETSVTFTNVFTVGAIEIEKVIDGPIDAYDVDGRFVIAVTCVLVDESGTRVVYDGDIVLGGGRPLRATVDDLSTGARCTFEETDTSGGRPTIVPSAVTVGDGTVASVVATNEYPVGSIGIEKRITGNLGASGAVGPFVVDVTCTLIDGEGSRTVYEGRVTLGGTQPLTARIDGLPTGARCTFVETVTGGGAVTISPASGVVVGDGTVATVTITNTFEGTGLPPTGATILGLLVLVMLSAGAGLVLLGVSRRTRRTADRP